MGGSSSAHPAGNRMAPSLLHKKLVQNNYRLFWSLDPEEPDRYHKLKRFDKFRELPEVSKPVWSFDLAEFTMVLAAAVADSGVYLWDLLMSPPEIKVTLTAHTAHVWACVFTPNELALATGSSDKTIRIWNAENGMPLQCLEAHTEGVRCLAFSMDGLLLSGGMDSQICLWEYDCNVPAAQWKAHDGHVHSIAFVRNRTSENRGLALSTGADGSVAAWYVEQGCYKALGRFAGGGGKGVLCVAQHTLQDNWCACGNEDGGVWVWNFAPLDFDTRVAGSDEDQIEIRGSVKLVGHKQGVRTLAFTPDGCLLASGSTDGHVRVWDVRQMHKECHEVNCVAVFTAHDSWVTELRFEGGARGLVTCSSDGLVKHWVAPARIKKLKGEVPIFNVFIQRMLGFSSYALGVDFKFHQEGLLVCKVSPGLMEEWNKRNPQRVVMPGDLVLSANGVRGDSKAMLEVCKTAEMLQLEIRLAEANLHKQLSQPTGFEPLRARPDHKAEFDEADEVQRKARHILEFGKDEEEQDREAIAQVRALFGSRRRGAEEEQEQEGDGDEGLAALADTAAHTGGTASPTEGSLPTSPGAAPQATPQGSTTPAGSAAGLAQGRVALPPHRAVLPRALQAQLAALAASGGAVDFGDAGSSPSRSPYAVVH